MAKTKATPKKKQPKRKARATKPLCVVNVKMTPAERSELKAMAKRHTAGNLSQWLRFAGRHYKPGKNEVGAVRS